MAVKAVPKPAGNYRYLLCSLISIIFTYCLLLGLASKSVFVEERGRADRSSFQSHLRSLTAYDRHKMLINEYFLSIPGAAQYLKRDQ